ncbi:hypothetical protein SLS59_004180 [Nothophoma quercina]|uniref:Extracellular membrane protein CFEM domain-containing protein n=1 Tax=Nothophoma quercina TaxID=749835 RepID=A0ABR3RJ26_9PLEO
MRSTISALLLALAVPTLALPNDCLPCAALCAYNKEWCAEAKCFTEMNGGAIKDAICGLSLEAQPTKDLQPVADVTVVAPTTMVTVVKATRTA